LVAHDPFVLAASRARHPSSIDHEEPTHELIDPAPGSASTTVTGAPDAIRRFHALVAEWSCRAWTRTRRVGGRLVMVCGLVGRIVGRVRLGRRPDRGTRNVLSVATELWEGRYGAIGTCVGSGDGVAIVIKRSASSTTAPPRST
jgi:hypothetical protein